MHNLSPCPREIHQAQITLIQLLAVKQIHQTVRCEERQKYASLINSFIIPTFYKFILIM